MHDKEEHPFYGHEILRQQEEEKVKSILARYKGEEANDALKKKIWDDLQDAKHKGLITIPFKVALRKDVYGKYPNYVEVILDTKV